MKQGGRSFNSFIVFLIMLVLVVAVLGLFNERRNNYTRSEFLEDLDSDRIEAVIIQPNAETPTGHVEVEMTDGSERRLFVTDIREIEDVIRERGYDPIVLDVERQSWVLTTLLPMLIVLVVGIFLFMMFNAQNTGGSNGKMMNFGKCRAKMSMGDP